MALDTLRTSFAELSGEVLASGRVAQMGDFVQHGTTSTLEHVTAVAYRSLALARGLRLEVDEPSLVRGAILHDYYLYDWHDHEQAPDRWHGFTHPRHALANAELDFPDLTETERDVIVHHMFPFVPVPPRTREGWIVCMADKLCTVQEFFGGIRARRRARQG